MFLSTLCMFPRGLEISYCICILFSYKDRFLSSLPASRRASADFSRPVFTAVAFYLCAKKHKVRLFSMPQDRILIIPLWFNQLLNVFLACFAAQSRQA